MAQTDKKRVTARFGYEGQKFSGAKVSSSINPIHMIIGKRQSLKFLWSSVIAFWIICTGVFSVSLFLQSPKVITEPLVATGIFVLYEFVRRALTKRVDVRTIDVVPIVTDDIVKTKQVSVSITFPTWIKAFFVGGLFVLVGSLAGLMLTPIVGNAVSVRVLFFTAAAGVAALWIVARIAPSYDAKR